MANGLNDESESALPVSCSEPHAQLEKRDTESSDDNYHRAWEIPENDEESEMHMRNLGIMVLTSQKRG
jgi:hypothetical protein